MQQFEGTVPGIRNHVGREGVCHSKSQKSLDPLGVVFVLEGSDLRLILEFLRFLPFKIESYIRLDEGHDLVRQIRHFHIELDGSPYLR